MQIAHEEARSLIRLRLDSRLSLDKQEILNAHLRGCHDCVTYADEIKEAEDILWSTMRKHWKPTAPPIVQLNAVTGYKNSRKAISVILSMRKIAVCTTLVLLGLITWNFIIPTPSYPANLTTTEASPIPTPSLTYTHTQGVRDCSQLEYHVREYDTLESIARQFSTSKEALMEINNLQSDSIMSQTELLVPLCEITPTGTTYAPTFTTTPSIKLTTYTPN